MEDHYSVLGVDQDASVRVIKRAYRELARQNHPDRNPGSDSAERFKRIVEAYDVLRNDERRIEYDAELRRVRTGVVMERLEDLFSVFSERERDRPRRGGNIVVEVLIDIGDILDGTSVRIPLERETVCQDCGGTGASEGVAYHACPTCRGWGEVTYRSATGSGIASRVEPCTKCSGTGKVIDEPCGACGGRGKVFLSLEESLNVPRGVEPDEVITVNGRGHGGLFGGEPGDLLVVVRVRDQPEFERDDLDLITDLRLSFAQAVLGADVEVSALDGPVMFTVPPGTEAGTELVLRDRGFPDRNGNRGDLRARVAIEVPASLTPSQREVLVHLAEEMGENVSQYRLRRPKRFFR